MKGGYAVRMKNIMIMQEEKKEKWKVNMEAKECI